MASRTDKIRATGQVRDLEDLRKLLRRAQAEVAELLKRTQAGDITRVQLQAELKEVTNELKKIGLGLHFYKL